MTEKTKDIIEIGVTSLLAIGTDYVIDKSLKKLVNPQNIPEKIVTGAGSLGISLAANYGIYQLVHGALNPSDADRYEVLVDECMKCVSVDSEITKKLIDIDIRVENKVDELYKKIIGGNVNG